MSIKRHRQAVQRRDRRSSHIVPFWRSRIERRGQGARRSRSRSNLMVVRTPASRATQRSSFLACSNAVLEEPDRKTRSRRTAQPVPQQPNGCEDTGKPCNAEIVFLHQSAPLFWRSRIERRGQGAQRSRSRSNLMVVRTPASRATQRSSFLACSNAVLEEPDRKTRSRRTAQPVPQQPNGCEDTGKPCNAEIVFLRRLLPYCQSERKNIILKSSQLCQLCPPEVI